MGFGRIIKSSIKFGGKLPGDVSKFGNKVIHTADKGLKIGSNILNIAGKAAGALESVPILGEFAGAASSMIKQGQGVLRGANNGLDRAQNINNKIARIKI